jgi:hypothetical protein
MRALLHVRVLRCTRFFREEAQMEVVWEIAIALGGALVSIGAALARREPREAPPPPSPASVKLQVNAAELEAVRDDVARLEARIEGIEERERMGAEHAAEFRGEMRAAIGRVFDKLNIGRGSVP